VVCIINRSFRLNEQKVYALDQSLNLKFEFKQMWATFERTMLGNSEGHSARNRDGVTKAGGDRHSPSTPA